MKLEKIVVGVDFSAQSQSAIGHTLDIARHLDAEMVLVHVCPVAEPPAHITEKNDGWQKFMRRQFTANRQRLEEMHETLHGQGANVSQAVIDAAPAAGLLMSADELDADLIVTGTHGYTGLDRLLLGSVAEQVIRDSKRSCMVVRGEFEPSGGYRRILVPTDFSASSEDALAVATTLVARGGTIDVRHFWHTPVFGPVPEPTELQARANEATGKRGAGLLKAHDGNEKYELSFSASHGNPKERILDLLDKGAYELVVMGSHNRHGVSRWLLGSVAAAAARHAPCSVMVVKRPPPVL